MEAITNTTTPLRITELVWELPLFCDRLPSPHNHGAQTGPDGRVSKQPGHLGRHITIHKNAAHCKGLLLLVKPTRRTRLPRPYSKPSHLAFLKKGRTFWIKPNSV